MRTCTPADRPRPPGSKPLGKTRMKRTKKKRKKKRGKAMRMTTTLRTARTPLRV